MLTNRETALAFLLGASMGAVAALLMAPASGTETRLRIRNRGEETLDRGKDVVQNTKAAVRNKVDDVRDHLTNASEVAHTRLDAARNAVAEGKAAYRRELDQPAV